jgi:diguanylate cyclase (GGDEF)-like protein
VSAVIPRDDRPDHPDRWQEDDELLVPIRSPQGGVLGFLSIDEPVSGLRPGPEQIEIAVTVTAAAASSVLGAQRALDARRNRQTLEILFELSTKLISSSDIDEVLQACCVGINQALGFERIVIELVDPTTGDLRHASALGWDEIPEPSSPDDIAAICRPEYEVEGCYLLTDEQALAIVGEQARRYESRRNGRGPLAWDHHWLAVPLCSVEGELVGWIWPDDPADHRLPSREALRILRTFANQALAAATDAGHVEQLQELARIDDLTGALNRRAFFERLDEELARTHRSHELVTLVLFDLDQFKAINDRYGHPAGDAALRSFVRILERNIRSTDSVGRVGGDEFALILSGATSEDTERVLSRIHETLDREPSSLATVRASHGIARSPDDGPTRDELVAAADARLYEAKRRRLHPPVSLVDPA